MVSGCVKELENEEKNLEISHGMVNIQMERSMRRYEQRSDRISYGSRLLQKSAKEAAHTSFSFVVGKTRCPLLPKASMLESMSEVHGHI